MQHLEVSGAVRPIYGSLGVKRLNRTGNGPVTWQTLRSVRAIIVAVEGQKLVHILIGIQHAGAHAQYCHLLPTRPYNVFQRYLVNGRIKRGGGGY